MNLNNNPCIYLFRVTGWLKNNLENRLLVFVFLSSSIGMSNLIWTNTRLNEVPEDAFDIPASCLRVSFLHGNISLLNNLRSETKNLLLP